MTRTLDRSDLLFDVELSRRIQVFGAWCGPAFVVLLFGGWGIMGGLVPLIPPAETAEYVASVYGTNAVVHRIGLIFGMIGVFLTIPYFLVISMQMRRMERRVPLLSVLQFASGIIVTVVLMIPMLLFVGASFRPERAPELTLLVNDLSYVMLILPWPPIIGQLGAIAVAGPFAWTGIVGFWIPAAVFGTWYLIMTKLLLTAIRREADEDRALADAVSGA